MANSLKASLLESLRQKYGLVKKLDRGLSLFEIGDGAARIYFRYSRIHDRQQGFYGLRATDLKKRLLSRICG